MLRQLGKRHAHCGDLQCHLWSDWPALLRLAVESVIEYQSGGYLPGGFTAQPLLGVCGLPFHVDRVVLLQRRELWVDIGVLPIAPGSVDRDQPDGLLAATV